MIKHNENGICLIKKRSGRLRFALALLVAFVFLSVFSKNSFLYPMNDWVDENCFFTVARSVLDGRVLYLDICEQKGPIVYFVFALAALVSRTSFIGVFIIELLCFAAFLYAGDQCVRLYRTKLALSSSAAVMVLLAFSISTSLSFSHGGSVEELSLFMLCFSMLFVLRAIKTGEPVKNREAALIGFFAGIAFWSKFTIMGFFLGLCLFVAVHLIKQRAFARLAKYAAAFLIGFSAVTIPVLIYFALNNALGAMAETYFYNNIVLYPSKGSGSAVRRLLSPVVNFVMCAAAGLATNGFCTLLLAFGAYYLVKFAKKRRNEALAVCFSVIPLAATTFIGGHLYAPYYALIIAFCAPLGAAAVLSCFQKSIKGSRRAAPRAVMVALAAVVLILVGMPLSRNTRLLFYNRDDMPQYRFAKIIAQKKGATMLNYGFLDGGFYFAAENTPKYKYFCELNVKLDEMYAEQRRYIEAREVDFVVTRGEALDELELDCSGYELVDTASFIFESREFVYRLYALKEAQTGAEQPHQPAAPQRMPMMLVSGSTFSISTPV